MNRGKLFNYATGLPRTFLGGAKMPHFVMFMFRTVGNKAMVPALGMLILLKRSEKQLEL